MDKTLLFIVNPRAGKTKSSAPLFDAVATFGRAGYLVRVMLTQAAGDAARFAAQWGGDYDLVLANIVSDVIIPLAPLVRPFMAQNAVFITSGIIDGRESDVAAALRSAGFEIEKHLHEEEWHCYICRWADTAS